MFLIRVLSNATWILNSTSIIFPSSLISFPIITRDSTRNLEFPERSAFEDVAFISVCKRS